MGDRTYVYFHVHGPINTLEQINGLLEAVKSENMRPSEFDGGDDSALEEYVVEAMANGETFLSFYDSEVNYGNVEELESFCQHEGITYHKNHGAGGDYEEGHQVFIPGVIEGTLGSYGSEDAVSISALEKALEYPDPIAAIKGLIETEKLARGGKMPDLVWGQEVKDHYAARVAGFKITGNHDEQ